MQFEFVFQKLNFEAECELPQKDGFLRFGSRTIENTILSRKMSIFTGFGSSERAEILRVCSLVLQDHSVKISDLYPHGNPWVFAILVGKVGLLRRLGSRLVFLLVRHVLNSRRELKF